MKQFKKTLIKPNIYLIRQAEALIKEFPNHGKFQLT